MVVSVIITVLVINGSDRIGVRVDVKVGGKGVGVAVLVLVSVAVGVWVGVRVAVAVLVGVAVGEAVLVGVASLVGVLVEVAVEARALSSPAWLKPMTNITATLRRRPRVTPMTIQTICLSTVGKSIESRVRVGVKHQ